MNDRRGVLLLFYDLPVLTASQRRNAAQFRKRLLKLGFTQVQESVYVQLVHNESALKAELLKIKSFAPKDGLVQVLPMSLQTFQGMQTLCGQGFNQNRFADDLVFL